ncbi:unnamed protein product [Kuraishia capsulata CBS 1993]|uniref:PUM-HD domain-containing protein n=1 Tax=Kuraishia capsulata CBS 1993 TaxID=1382522 RepID=W6MNN8_9ASCO|nr:uncharacterized protein KUCA_T00004266001 [Kuraishia capsulata CBS 1993]CDK28284.1 unnamed protein product [Kuraishia capsulata CBS 1993]
MADSTTEDHSQLSNHSGSGSSATTTPTKDGSSILSGSVDPFLQTPLTPPKSMIPTALGPQSNYFNTSFTPFDPLGSTKITTPVQRSNFDHSTAPPTMYDPPYFKSENSGDLDLSVALGNLNLDYDLMEMNKGFFYKGDASSASTISSSIPSGTTGGTNTSRYQPHQNGGLDYQRAGSLTPNPSSSFFMPKTPTWSAPTMPASAPPARSFIDGSNFGAMGVRPFNLPEEQNQQNQAQQSQIDQDPLAAPSLQPSLIGGPLLKERRSNQQKLPQHVPSNGMPLTNEQINMMAPRSFQPNFQPNFNVDQTPVWNNVGAGNGMMGNNAGQAPRNSGSFESFDSRRWNGNRVAGNANGPGSLNSSGGPNMHRKPTQRRKGEDASRFVNAKLQDFMGEICTLCKDQHGCRFLQRQLDVQGEYAAVVIFNEIVDHVVDLMVDPFGNYLVQKLLEKLPTDLRTTFVRNASSQFVRIALDPHGTRALQKLVECISTDEEAEVLRDSLTPHVVVLSRDLNGNHVVQKCLQMLRPDQFQFIFDCAYENCSKIATHRHGCCVLQRCLDHGSKEQCEALSVEVSKNCIALSLDPFGNYVVQYVIGRECKGIQLVSQIPEHGAMATMLESIKVAVFKLSLHKFGSNVTEKCLRIPFIARVLIDYMLDNPAEVQTLLHDAFGNYVLQTSLDVADAKRFEDLSAVIKPLLPSVRSTPHGRRISGRIQQRSSQSSASSAHRHSSSSSVSSVPTV